MSDVPVPETGSRQPGGPGPVWHGAGQAGPGGFGGAPSSPPPGWPDVPSPWQSAPPAASTSAAPWRGSVPPGQRPVVVPGGRRPSGLFPSGPRRPIYREPLPAHPGAVLVGAGAGVVWMLLFGLLGHGVRGYFWWSLGAAVVAWAAAVILARSGDRGVAAGAAMSAGVGLAIAVSVVVSHWAGGHWPLW